MSWGKVDDGLWGHPKWLATSKGGRALWVTALSWSMDQLTDGHVPRHVLPSLGASARDAADLVRVGLWEVVDGGWIFHDWLERQPSRESVLGEREAARERMRKAREARRKRAADATDTDQPDDGSPERSGELREKFGGSSGNVRVTPTRPDPTRPIEVLPVGTSPESLLTRNGESSSSSSASVMRGKAVG